MKHLVLARGAKTIAIVVFHGSRYVRDGHTFLAHKARIREGVRPTLGRQEEVLRIFGGHWRHFIIHHRWVKEPESIQPLTQSGLLRRLSDPFVNFSRRGAAGWHTNFDVYRNLLLFGYLYDTFLLGREILAAL